MGTEKGVIVYTIMYYMGDPDHESVVRQLT